MYIMKGLSYKDKQTGVIFGFLKRLLSFGVQFKPDAVVFAWDSKSSIRKKEYPDYKANRKKSDLSEEEKELLDVSFAQFDELREGVLPRIGFRNVFMWEGYEADDIIANVVKERFRFEKEMVVVTTDDDLYQLLDLCSLWDPYKKRLYTRADFIKEWGIDPIEWSMVKCLAGCSSDNVRGISGVGYKTAAKYLRKELSSNSKVYKKIESEKSKFCEVNFPLVHLPKKVKTFPIFNDSFNIDEFEQVCEAYGFYSFLKKDVLKKWAKCFGG